MDDISDIQRDKYMEDHNLSPEEMERTMWEELFAADSGCQETRRKICINCMGVTTGKCERGMENCKYVDGAFMATLCMIVLLCILFWGIFYKFVFKLIFN